MCTTQLVELEDNYEAIKNTGAELLAISSENVSTTKKTTENEGLTYPVLADTHRDVINAYNVLDQTDKSIARPAAYIIAQDGTVAWKSLDSFSNRVPTATILTELGKL